MRTSPRATTDHRVHRDTRHEYEEILMNRREERWGRSGGWGSDDYEWRRDPGRFRNEESDVERGGGWGRSGEYQGREPGVRSQSGSGRWDSETSGGRGGDYYGGREDYRGREDHRGREDYRSGDHYRGSEGGRGEWRGTGMYESERPFGMDYDAGRVLWRRGEPSAGSYGADRYGSGYEDRGGRGGYSQRSERRDRDDDMRYSSGRLGEGANYPSGLGYGEQGESHGPQGFGRGGGRLMRYGRHEREDWSTAAQGRYSGVGPKGYKRSPERLKEQVCDLLEEHGELDASDIDVKVEASTVTLSGTVDDRRAKRLAEDLAESVTGVTDVSNQIKVRSRDDERSTEGFGSESTRGSRSGKEGSRTSATGGSASKPGGF
jgi:hypothetical protein